MTLNRYKNSTGFTMVELVLGVALISLLVTSVILLVNPTEKRAMARDEKRLSDLSMLDRVINEFKLDTGAYPDSVDTTRISTALPTGNSGPLFDSATGWIVGDFSQYTNILPTDPLNDATYFYSYRQDGYGYEINALLEQYFDKASEDGGNDDMRYEMGNNLTIL